MGGGLKLDWEKVHNLVKKQPKQGHLNKPSCDLRPFAKHVNAESTSWQAHRPAAYRTVRSLCGFYFGFFFVPPRVCGVACTRER